MAIESDSYIDYPALRANFDSNRFSSGRRADLRKAATPEDLLLRPAYYALMGSRTKDCWLRVAFLIPWIKHRKGAGGLGKALAKAGADEKRLFQVLRSHAPNDLIQLRRLVQHTEPVADWQYVGKMLFWWRDQHDLSHRMLLEQFYTTASEGEPYTESNNNFEKE